MYKNEKLVPMAAQSKAHTVFVTAQTLGSQVQIPLGAWMCVHIFLCCVVLCR